MLPLYHRSQNPAYFNFLATNSLSYVSISKLMMEVLFVFSFLNNQVREGPTPVTRHVSLFNYLFVVILTDFLSFNIESLFWDCLMRLPCFTFLEVDQFYLMRFNHLPMGLLLCGLNRHHFSCLAHLSVTCFYVSFIWSLLEHSFYSGE